MKSLAGNLPLPNQLNDWIDSFHKNGFLVIPNVLASEQCAELRQDLDTALETVEGESYIQSRKIMKRMFERSQHNLNLFALEPILTFAEQLIGGANGANHAITDGIPNANMIHVIHNNSFKLPPETDGLAKNTWHQDDTPHVLSFLVIEQSSF
jgi:Phytanoyl-CoA dioxygenase (PhyH)